MQRIVSTLLLGACAALGTTGCATAPDEAEARPRPIVSEAVTGSNVPRRDGKKGVSPVVTVSGESMKEALSNTQVPLKRNGQP